jgi:hypothetical protein
VSRVPAAATVAAATADAAGIRKLDVGGRHGPVVIECHGGSGGRGADMEYHDCCLK